MAAAALERLHDDEAHAPNLWWFEVRNTLISSERRGRISAGQTAAFLTQLSRLQITMDHAPNESGVLNISRQYKLTVYDAAYLELAQRENLSLATLDKALANAAISAGVTLVGNIAGE